MKEFFEGDQGKAFLDVFSKDLADRDKRTQAAQAQGAQSGIKDTDKDKKSALPGMSKIAPDVSVQQGYRGSEFTLAGRPAKKGFGGTLIRGLGVLAAPATGGASIVAANVGAEASGADYW